MDFSKWVCRMLVVLIVFVMDAKIVFSLIPICSLNTTSKRIPKTNVAKPITIEIFRYLVVSISLSITWEAIKNTPKRPKNMMSFPLDDPIKNWYVIGLMIGLKMLLTNIAPPRSINSNPIMIVLLTFINNNLSINSLNK